MKALLLLVAALGASALTSGVAPASPAAEPAREDALFGPGICGDGVCNGLNENIWTCPRDCIFPD